MRLRLGRKYLTLGILLCSAWELQAVQPSRDTLLFLQEVVITGSRSERPINRTPARIQTLTSLLLQHSPGQSVDDLLSIISGINTTRSGSIAEMQSQVSIRGLAGNEQGRTLVLLDGVPVNTSDDGSVNWNSLSLLPLQRIEVLKGPGSSLYGNHALGGVIHLITKQPTAPWSLEASTTYGSLQSWKGTLSLSGRLQKPWSWYCSTYYQRSDGFNTVPKEERGIPDYTIPRFVREGGGMAKIAFTPTSEFNVEFSADLYRDKRGEGEKIRTADGLYRRFNHNRFQGRLSGTKEQFSYQWVAYFQRQHYFRLDERLKAEVYQRFDVKSNRDDWGILGQLRWSGAWSEFAVGGEMKRGAVHGGDYYVTSSDRVENRGTMTFVSCFVQEELKGWRGKMWLQLALRYDRALFHRGWFEAVGDQVAAFALYNGPLENNRWKQLSPQLALRLNVWRDISFYGSYAHGFRASILDDLCRSGWMWVGPKVANPELKPERLKQYEGGVDWRITKQLDLASSLYYARGDDFLYYVATGEKIGGKQDIFRRENVSEVELKGVEVDLNYQPMVGLKLHLNYTYSLPKIRQFKERPELVGSCLTYAPKIQWKGYLLWTGGGVDVMLRGVYKTKQYATEDNKSVLPAFSVWDLRLSRCFFQQRFYLQAEVLNVWDRRHLNTKEQLSAGRLIHLKLTLNLNKL